VAVEEAGKTGVPTGFFNLATGLQQTAALLGLALLMAVVVMEGKTVTASMG
jgi:hypothetical protein